MKVEEYQALVAAVERVRRTCKTQEQLLRVNGHQEAAGHLEAFAESIRVSESLDPTWRAWSGGQRP